jgi:hypothetical protein
MDIWTNSSRTKKGAIIVAVVVVGFLLCKWMGWV